MAMLEDSGIRLFGGALDPQTAWEWDKAKILSFMREVARHPYLFDIPEEREQGTKALINAIHGLSSPDGPDFAGGPDKEPHQPTRRKLNPEWGRIGSASISKFLLDPLVHQGVPLTSLFDLIGAFLSVNKAPPSATAKDFFLPVLGLYDRWCHAMYKTVPIMLQGTWVSKGLDMGQFALGASCFGYRTKGTGDWKRVVQEGRWALLDDEHMVNAGYSMLDTPQTRVDVGVWYGNCAETVPFVMLLRGRSNADHVHGIALKRTREGAETFKDEKPKLRGRAKPPCENCEELIRMYGGKLENFAVDQQ